MSVALALGFTLFGWGMRRRLRALSGGERGTPPAFPRDQVARRLGRLVAQAILQRRLRRELGPGLAHLAISAGFLVLLLRTLVLWGRGFDPGCCLLVLGPAPLGGWLPLGAAYCWLKDLAILAVLAGVAGYGYLRLVRRAARLTLNGEGLLVLALIAAMMIADATYDGATLALAARVAPGSSGPPADEVLLGHLGPSPPPPSPRWFPDPVGSAVAAALAPLPAPALRALGHGGYWAHVLLVLTFLVLLPHGKHFHVLTAAPNVFFGDLGPPGRLRPLAPTAEALGALVDRAAELADPHQAPLGIARIEHLAPKARLDLFACTECGRCSARCPATLTGRALSPKAVIVALRGQLRAWPVTAARAPSGLDLVPAVISPDALWACTTCRACEEECPVTIEVVDKLVGLRRHLLTVRGEPVPPELGPPLAALERTGNPYGLPAAGRAAWAEGLGIPTFAERPETEVLFWVGCAATFDPRARRIARATAALLRAAGIDFGILGAEERCTGDLARRAGHEALFLTLAEQNRATLARYAAAGGVRRIVTGCPHCYHTLRHEYPDLGVRYPVLHTAQLLAELLAAGRLAPRRPIPGRVVVHDACYLARYAGDVTSARAVLARVPELEVVEVRGAHGRRALCCGGGGAQILLPERSGERIEQRRARDLLATGAELVATSCPYCMTLLGDGLAAVSDGGRARPRDVAELLADACGLGVEPAGTSAPAPAVSPDSAGWPA